MRPRNTVSNSAINRKALVSVSINQLLKGRVLYTR